MKTVFRQSFARDLKKIKTRLVLNRVQDSIKQVEQASSLEGVKGLKKLQGSGNYYRIRIGEYRIGLALAGDTVEFVRCLPRRDLYRYFP